MATKTKSSETAAPVPSTSLEATFSEGLKQLDAGNLEAAAATFSSVQEQASATEQLNLGRAARGYLAAIQARPAFWAPFRSRLAIWGMASTAEARSLDFEPAILISDGL